MPRRKKAASSRFVTYDEIMRERAAAIVHVGSIWSVSEHAPPTGDTPPPAERPLPRWDEGRRTLFLGETCVKRYNHGPAANQIDIIAAFQNARWPSAIDDPFGDPRKL